MIGEDALHTLHLENYITNLQVIETYHAHQLLLMLSMFSQEKELSTTSCILPIFLQRINGLYITNSPHTALILRIYSNSSSDSFSVAFHGVTFETRARHMIFNKPFTHYIECCNFVGKFSYDNTQTVNKICLVNETNEEKEWNNVTGLFISIWNETERQFEIESVMNCCLWFDDIVYRSLSLNDIIHNQYSACDKTGKHIIIPFTSTLFKNQVGGSINFSRIETVNVTIQLKPSTNLYQIYISSSRLATLDSSNGYLRLL